MSIAKFNKAADDILRLKHRIFVDTGASRKDVRDNIKVINLYAKQLVAACEEVIANAME